MDWFHICNLDWLKERQKHLTASEIKQLLPITLTGRPKKITELDYISIMANKLIKLNEDDCKSFGAAARGHILEPYAIKDFNVNYGQSLIHWDDICLHNNIKMGLGYSPDALDIKPSDPTNNAKIIGEVKCYSAHKHLATALSPKYQLVERWQIATGMAVLPSIEKGYLILYHPSLDTFQLKYHLYTKDELEEEIKLIKNVEKNWLNFIEEFKEYKELFSKASINEIELYQKINKFKP